MRRRRRCLIVLAVLALAATAVTCIAPKALRQVRSPREGRVLNHRVAVVYSSAYQIDLGGAERLHPFDIRKYARIYLALNQGGYLRPADVFVPVPVSRGDLLRVHTRRYLNSLRDPAALARYLEAPAVKLLPGKMADSGLLRAFRAATGGTILAARLALEHGIAINLGGGYHHAKPDSGEGFCIYADMPIALRALRAEGRLGRVLVVDLDVHQGNGTAVCCRGDDGVFLFDMHQGDIYPIPKERCTLDVDLPRGTTDDEYLRVLADRLPGAIDRARPDLVFLQAGCDVLAGDPLAGLALTKDGIVRRDAFVIDMCVRRGLPVVMVLGGGYSDEAWAVQYASICRTIETYGLVGGVRPHPPRKANLGEKLYTK